VRASYKVLTLNLSYVALSGVMAYDKPRFNAFLDGSPFFARTGAQGMPQLQRGQRDQAEAVPQFSLNPITGDTAGLAPKHGTK